MVASLLAIARDSNELVCMECLQCHGRINDVAGCERQIARPFKGLFEYVWAVKRVDDENPDLNDYVLWRELKKQIRILREEMDNEQSVKK